MKEKQTPLLKQYNQIKNKYSDTVLLFRMGDFFETFNEDAEITSKVCGIALTKRNNGGAADMPLAGFPHHQLDAYLPKLVRAGYRVAVCEQLEDPKFSRGIVKRDVIEVVTPGVALYEKLLDSKHNNYLASIYIEKTKNDINKAGFAFCDISTGEFFTSEFAFEQLVEILETIVPAEILYSKEQKILISTKLAELSFKPSETKLEPWIFDNVFAKEALMGNFKTKTLKGFGIEEFSAGITAAGAILHYINETQKTKLEHIRRISIYNPSDYMPLDYSTRRNLEITSSMYDNQREGTLISILDKTNTPMGGRLLKKWISQPLRKIETINRRLNAVTSLFENDDVRNNLRKILSEISDIERLISKICTARANPRDIISLKQSILKIPLIKEKILVLENDSLTSLSNGLKPLKELTDLIEFSIVEEPSTQIGSGNVFRNGYSQELDDYVEAKYSAKNWISKYQENQRLATGINSLKISFNNVFGYYIEVTNAHSNKVPDTYKRKQTLTNAERYTTPELKEFEEKILNAEEKISEIELQLFSELRNKIAEYTESIQDNALRIANLDCLQSFAQTSREYNYCKPQINDSDIIEIVEGRHPVVERLLPIGESFTSNSTILDTDNEMIHIITGPNMSGKSCYLRQVGLIVLLAQIGCYVPAQKAQIGIVDRIFTRVGAQDNIIAGESTFLVEMQEAANIINNATNKSLILLDEVGRGTATFDGISIAWAISEYIHNAIRAKTLFATHYHELNELANLYENIANYQIEVIEAEGKVIFSHKVKPGGSDHSFGIHVAEMAGLPQDVTSRAKDIMLNLEQSSKSDDNVENIKINTTKLENVKPIKSKRVPEQLSIFELRDDAIREKIRSIDTNNITPIQALKILSDLTKQVNK